MHKYDNIPELAGIATYTSATRIGWSVDENVKRLLRLHWTERRLMSAMIAHITAEPVWEVKCALGLHQYQSAERVDALRDRIAEMRSPVPRLDAAPDGADDVDRYFDEVLATRTTAELLTAVYGVTLPALREAYRAHLEGCNPLVDHPTVRLIRSVLPEMDDAIRWGANALQIVGVDKEYRTYLAMLLQGDTPARAPRRARPEFRPRRDERFKGQHNFEFAPHVVYNMPEASAEERNLALLCKRTLEMDVPEMMASFMTERADQPWEFHRDYSRQLWDEMRHAMMGTVALQSRGIKWKRDVPLNVSFALRLNLHATPIERQMMASFMTERADQPWEFHRDYSRQLWDEMRHAMMGTVALQSRGIKWKRDVPLNVSFALRLNLHATPIERQMMLFAIEQSLMPSETGKRFEYQTAVAAGDELSAHFHDYDWADEVLHAQIGRRALKREGITPDEARERSHEIHEKTWAALDQYRELDEQRDWWPEFVREHLGRESAAVTAPRPELNIFSE